MNSTEMRQPVVKTYQGTHREAVTLFQRDALVMAKQGYFPVSQDYSPGAYGCGAFLIALLLCLVLVGILVFIYMLFVKPPGTLTVVYEYRESDSEEDTDGDPAKICPMCAESVKEAAKICRYCGHEFG